jgi:hypothetical protein
MTDFSDVTHGQPALDAPQESGIWPSLGIGREQAPISSPGPGGARGVPPSAFSRPRNQNAIPDGYVPPPPVAAVSERHGMNRPDDIDLDDLDDDAPEKEETVADADIGKKTARKQAIPAMHQQLQVFDLVRSAGQHRQGPGPCP